MDLLQKWQKILSENAEEGGDGETSKTNGEAADAEKSEGEAATSAGVKDKATDKKDSAEPASAKDEPAEDPVEDKTELSTGAADEAADGDVEMFDDKEPDAPEAAYVPPTTNGEAVEETVEDATKAE